MSKMNRRSFLRGSVGLFAATAVYGHVNEAWKTWTKSGGSLQKTFPFKVPFGQGEDDLALLNHWGKQPEHIQNLFMTAYKKLSSGLHVTYSELVKGPDFQKICKEKNILHLGGPMLGAVSSEGANVWVRTVKPAKVEVLVTDRENKKTLTFAPVKSTEESDLVAIVPVRGLEASKYYPYRVRINGEFISIPANAAITTVGDEKESGKVRITFGTCFHRWGLGNYKQSAMIRARHPEAMLLGGDIAAQDRNNHCGLHRSDYLLRDLFPAWQDLTACIPVYATWDDHDYFDNDKFNVPTASRRFRNMISKHPYFDIEKFGMPDKFTESDKQNVCRVFRNSWNNPEYATGKSGEGIYFRTRIGPCDVIMLDQRYFREKGSLLGEEQMKWLEAALLDCKGPFIILSGGTMWCDYVSGNGKDSWGMFDPEGRERIFKLIEKHRIGGVLLISGDRHGARGFRIPRDGGFNFYEFEPASLGGRTGPKPTRPEWDTQLFGFSDVYAFGEFSIDASLSDPEVTFRLIRDNGDVLYKLTLKRSELTPPKSIVNI